MQARTDVAPRPACVLVVDDDERVRRLCARTLRRDGFTVLEAESGWEAIECVADRGEAIDLVLTDIVMPGLTGVELVGRLLASRPRLGIVMMSGYVPAELLRRGIALTGLPFLQKPFTLEELCREVRGTLDGRSGARDG